MAKIIVLGGGLSGFFAALAARRAGHDVSLADSHSFLGRELTATGHSWLRNGKTDFELYAPVGGMKKYLLQTLIDEGVTL